MSEKQCQCDGCGWTGPEGSLECVMCDIPDFFERVEPGGVIPVGECPKCGALAYLVKKPKPNAALAALQELHTAFIGTDLARGYIFARDRKRIENAMADAGFVIAKSKGVHEAQSIPA